MGKKDVIKKLIFNDKKLKIRKELKIMSNELIKKIMLPIAFLVVWGWLAYDFCTSLGQTGRSLDLAINSMQGKNNRH